MSLFQYLRKKLKSDSGQNRVDITAAEGYDLWSEQYDHEPGNLMVALDEEIFPAFLNKVPLAGKTIVDVGCGTGRHWSKLLSQSPERLIGFDVSEGMLQQLRAKHPGAEVQLMTGYTLDGLADQSVDLVMSTLALAHFTGIEAALQDWARVLQPGGSIIITDAHPESFTQGADITFGHHSKTYAVEYYIYPLEQIRGIAAANGLRETDFAERKVDEAVKHVYEAQHALKTYLQFEGVPLIYGIHFVKQ